MFIVMRSVKGGRIITWIFDHKKTTCFLANSVLLILIILGFYAEATPRTPFKSHEIKRYNLKERSTKTPLFLPVKNFLDGDTIAYSGKPFICSGNSILLKPSKDEPGATYKWIKDGAVIANTPTITVYTGGKYSLVTVANGQTTTYPPLVIKEGETPVAQFNYTQGQCSSTAVVFKNTSTGSDLTYLWGFGDPNSGKGNRTSTLANPSHIFIGTPGNGSQTFTVTLTVTSKGGCTSVVTKTVTLLQVPDTDIEGTGKTSFNGRDYFAQCTNMPSLFTFTNKSKTDNISYSITWGDGTGRYDSPNFTTLTHTYRVGDFTMFYTINGKNGCSVTKKYYVFVGTTPTAKLTATSTNLCIGSPLTITVSDVKTNSAGTIYLNNYNDGSTQRFYETPPDTLMHTFFTNSLNKVAQVGNTILNNSFSASLIAANPCGADTAVLAPIYVDDLPKASFSILTPNVICSGATAQFDNTKQNRIFFDSNGKKKPNNFIWEVSPNTGFTAVNSTLGSDQQNTDPSFWTPGSPTLSLNFTAAGTYTIKLKSGNSSCGLDSTSRSICVNPEPVANFDVNNSEGCGPLTVSTTNSSNLPLCGIVKYKWAVTYSNNGCGNYTSDFTYTSGNNTSAAPAFQFNNPGIYTITLITYFNDETCTSAVCTKQITVKTKPVVSITSANKLYTHHRIKPKADVSNCYSSNIPTYSWTFEGGTPASSSALEPDSIGFDTPGNYLVTLSVTNDCGTTTATQTIRVTDYLSLPDALIPNCFSPNADGINDTWDIKGIDNNHSLFLRIFNRYGNLIFEQKGNPISWNGEYNGRKMPGGVYYYILTYDSNRIGLPKRSGSVSLIY
ncbi:MAG: hypothetical protein JWQ66_3379 [Mucilaginibacter sp.]|nr:hypothetical protein [Mucilaginibacter sp.]